MRTPTILPALAAALISATAALAQSYSIPWHNIDGGGGTSTGGGYSLSGTIGQPDAGRMSGGGYSLAGGFWSLASEATPGAPTILFDNSNGSFNGQQAASTNSWLAGKFCLGSQAYTLDSVTLFLNSGDISGRPHESTVLLQIFSSLPVTGRPFTDSGPTMILSGTTNPITLASGNVSTPFKWIPAAPFTLQADECYWAVLSVESGAIAYQHVTVATPTGPAGTLGRSYSPNAGVSWVPADVTSNYKMLIMGTAAAPNPALMVTAVSVEGSDLRFTLATTAGRIYAIESRAGLASGAWEEVPGTRQTSAGAAFEMSLPILETQPLQFFRVKQFP
jgi:hypothetical protein